MIAGKACADEAGAMLTQHQNFDPVDVAADDERFGGHPLVAPARDRRARPELPLRPT